MFKLSREGWEGSDFLSEEKQNGVMEILPKAGTLGFDLHLEILDEGFHEPGDCSPYGPTDPWLSHLFREGGAIPLDGVPQGFLGRRP
jgi:hypothetical protein